MHTYDRGFTPPAPVLRAKFVKPVNGGEKELDSLLDSGASLSVIPEALISELGLIPQTRVKIRAYDKSEEEAKEVDGYYINVTVEGKQFDLIKVVTTRQRIALIGRDILNKGTLLLDGKKSQFELKW